MLSSNDYLDVSEAENSSSAKGTPAAHPDLTYWDRVAQTTRWGRYVTEVERQVILRGEEYAGGPGRAVDLGCGGGRWSKLLADRNWKVTCVDVNRHSLSICQRNVPSAQCILGRPKDRTIPLPSNSASLALCIEVVPLIEAEWFPLEVHRLLSDSGIFVGVYINGRSLRGMASRLKHRLVNRQNGYNFYQSSYSDWRRRLIQIGFEMVHEESCCWGPFTRDSNSPFVPAFTRMERVLRLNRILAFSPWVVFIARKQRAGLGQ